MRHIDADKLAKQNSRKMIKSGRDEERKIHTDSKTRDRGTKERKEGDTAEMNFTVA